MLFSLLKKRTTPRSLIGFLVCSCAFLAVACFSSNPIQEAARSLHIAADVLQVDKILGNNVSKKIEPEFEPYVQRWTQETKLTVDFGIRFTQKDPGFLRQLNAKESVGYCIFYPSGESEVRISRKKWSRYNIPSDDDRTYNLYKEMVVFHELGHCSAKLGHSDVKTQLALGKAEKVMGPNSIMYPSDLELLETYKRNRVHYLQELRGQIAANPLLKAIQEN